MENKLTFKILTHFLFWLVYIIVLFVFDSPYYWEMNTSWYDKIDINLLVLVFAITYTNDQLLLPYFFKRKAYGLYTFIILSSIYLATIFYCYYITNCYYDDQFSCLSDNLWIIIIPVVFLSFIWMVLEFFDKQQELEKIQKERLELELKFLKSQINPHVLFNNLNTIYAKAVKENDSIAELILMLSENLKYVLNQSNDTFVNLEEDINFIENYLKFQALRTQGINNIIYKKEIDSYDLSIAPLLLIDLIENAFKYSVYKDDVLSDIDIFLKVQRNQLHFICKNEYNTLAKEKDKRSQIGLKNLYQRLQLIYKDKFSLDINKDYGVYTIDLKIILE